MRVHVATCPDSLIASVVAQELTSAGYPATMITPLGAAYIIPGPVRIFLEDGDPLRFATQLAEIEEIVGTYAVQDVFDDAWTQAV